MRSRTPLLGLLLVLGGATEVAAASRAGVALEYSTFLDIHRQTALRHDAASAVSAFGLRVHGELVGARFRLGTALSFYPSQSLACSHDFFLTWTRRWLRLALDLGGGFGYLLTLEGTMVPTYTGVTIGPSFPGRGQLAWSLWRGLAIEAGLGLYRYQAQPTIGIPVGIDIRWHLGLSLAH